MDIRVILDMEVVALLGPGGRMTPVSSWQLTGSKCFMADGTLQISQCGNCDGKYY